MQPELLHEVREWLQRACDDLREAEHDLNAVPELVRGALLHCQQAAEKAFKAFLTAHQHPFRKTHNLGELGTEAIGCDATLAEIAERAVELTPYAWRFQYPGVPDEPAVDEAREALAREVYHAILARLPEEARP